MKRLLLFFTILISLNTRAQSWGQLADFPSHSRDDGTAFILGDTAYCGTGLTPWWSAEGDFYGFDINAETWFPVQSLPDGKERQYASGFSGNSRGFVFGGLRESTYLNDLWMYNPVSDAWEEKTPMPSLGRSGASCFVLNDTAYIIGGKTLANSAIDEVWAYSILTDSWSQKNNFPFGNTWRASATNVNGSGYLLFGVDEANQFQNSLYEYHPSTDSWSEIGTFPSNGRSYASMNSTGNSLYINCGMDSLGNLHNDLWEYAIAQDNWNVLPGIPSLGRRGGMSFSHGKKLYYTTGLDESFERLKETWKYDPTLDVTEISSIHITLSPNPTTGIVQIHAKEEIESIEIYSSQGKLIQKTVDASSVDFTHLNNGVYFLKIYFDHQVIQERVVKI